MAGWVVRRNRLFATWMRSGLSFMFQLEAKCGSAKSLDQDVLGHRDPTVGTRGGPVSSRKPPRAWSGCKATSRFSSPPTFTCCNSTSSKPSAETSPQSQRSRVSACSAGAHLRALPKTTTIIRPIEDWFGLRLRIMPLNRPPEGRFVRFEAPRDWPVKRDVAAGACLRRAAGHRALR